MSTDYLAGLKEQIGAYEGTWKDVVSLTPAFAELMFKMLADPRLKREHKLLVDAAIAYLVSPDDVIPEKDVGAYGYLDDLFCLAYVTNRIAVDRGWELIQESWPSTGSVHELVDRILAREHELLGHAGDDVLRYAGLYEPEDAGGPKPIASI
ncbi:MAG: DUF1232 domain-containing protein [Gemmatimonadota bacterium]